MAEIIAQEGVRLSTALVAMGAAANVTVLVHTQSPGKRAVIKKIIWHNRTGAPGVLRFGFLTLGAVFTQVLPDIFMVAGLDGQLNENDLPICGNTPQGFAADTTAVTGTLGAIQAQSSVAGVAPADVQVRIEVEEIG